MARPATVLAEQRVGGTGIAVAHDGMVEWRDGGELIPGLFHREALVLDMPGRWVEKLERGLLPSSVEALLSGPGEWTVRDRQRVMKYAQPLANGGNCSPRGTLPSAANRRLARHCLGHQPGSGLILAKVQHPRDRSEFSSPSQARNLRRPVEPTPRRRPFDEA